MILNGTRILTGHSGVKRKISSVQAYPVASSVKQVLEKLPMSLFGSLISCLKTKISEKTSLSSHQVLQWNKTRTLKDIQCPGWFLHYCTDNDASLGNVL